MVQVIKDRILEWKKAGMGTRIGMEDGIILSSDDYDTFTIIAVDLNKDGTPIAIVEEDMGSHETSSGLEYLSIDILAQIIDDLRIEVPDRLLPQAEQAPEYQPILAAFEAARDTTEALKDRLLAAVGKAHEVLYLDLAEPPSDEDLAKLYPTDELDDAISFKDNHDGHDCLAEFSRKAEELGYRHLFTHDRVDYYAKP